MRNKTLIKRETVAVSAAANVLFAVVAAIAALWAGASLAAIPWIVAMIIYAIGAISIANTQTPTAIRQPVTPTRRAARPKQSAQR